MSNTSNQVIKYSILLCLGIQGLFASDVSNKRESIITQTTKLLPPLAALVNGYHGPAYYKGFFRQSGNSAHPRYDRTIHHVSQIFMLKHPCADDQPIDDENCILRIYRIYRHKNTEDLLAMANVFDSNFKKKGVSCPDTALQILGEGKKQIAIKYLKMQEAVTKYMRQRHPEIPFSNEAHVAICECNNKVIVASAGNSIEVWPLDCEVDAPSAQHQRRQNPSCCAVS